MRPIILISLKRLAVISALSIKMASPTPSHLLSYHLFFCCHCIIYHYLKLSHIFNCHFFCLLLLELTPIILYVPVLGTWLMPNKCFLNALASFLGCVRDCRDQLCVLPAALCFGTSTASEIIFLKVS